MNRKYHPGISIIELFFAVAIVAIGAALSITYLSQQKTLSNASVKSADNSKVDAKSSTTSAATTAPITPVDTTADINSQILQAVDAESAIDSSADSQIQDTATRVNSAITNISGAYDVTNL